MSPNLSPNWNSQINNKTRNTQLLKTQVNKTRFQGTLLLQLSACVSNATTSMCPCATRDIMRFCNITETTRAEKCIRILNFGFCSWVATGSEREACMFLSCLIILIAVEVWMWNILTLIFSSNKKNDHSCYLLVILIVVGVAAIPLWICQTTNIHNTESKIIRFSCYNLIHQG